MPDMAATDPETTLCIGTGLVRDLPADQCQPHWDYEFLVPDYLKYADIVRSGRRVADIHDATAGRPERSPRFKQFSAATGFRSEVRLVFTVGDAAWVTQLNRATDVSRRREGMLERRKGGLRCPGPGGLVASRPAPQGVAAQASCVGRRRLRVAATREAVEWPTSSPPSC
jgi:hypothetical protein